MIAASYSRSKMVSHAIVPVFFKIAMLLHSDPILHLNQGPIRGGIFISRSGREFKAFQGIPFAKPPIGDLRFKDPEPFDSWGDDMLNATSEPNSCVQKNILGYDPNSYKTTGHEDCLYLNVYTPMIPKNGDKKLLPVMVWIHGGGYFACHGGMSYFGSQFLLDKDVVVVSINYRLGILGFLSTEDDNLPGNYGMKDQVLALKWVQTNIEKFGGNRQKVTIFGQSAGGSSVGLHLLSPLSKGLFHKAIMQSGTPLCAWAVSPPGWARRRALTLSTFAGCPDDTKFLAECLRKISAKHLTDLQSNFNEWDIFPMVKFGPVVENCEKTNGFLCDYPTPDFLQKSNIPVMMGFNSFEGGFFATKMYDKSCTFIASPLKENFHMHVSSTLFYKYTCNMSDITIIGDKLLSRYFPTGNIDNPSGLVNMITSGMFLRGSIDTATNLTSPVLFYVYNHQNNFSFNMISGPCTRPLGVTHGDEMTSLFALPGVQKLTGDDLFVSNLMVNLWTRFASDLVNTVSGNVNGIDWPLFDANKQQYLLIHADGPVVAEQPYPYEYTFWKNLPLHSALNVSKSAPKT